jgi:DNA-binding NtrC family response regulator
MNKMNDKNKTNAIVKIGSSTLTRIDQKIQIANKLLHEFEGRKTVLIVDDESQLLQSIEDLLKYYFHDDLLDILTALDGFEALDIIESKNGKIDLMTTCLRMPGMCGIELISAVREKFKHIKIIVISAGGSKKNKQKSLNMGANLFLDKPIDVKEYLKIIKDILNLYIKVLLPYYLNSGFKDIFENLGFRVFWSEDMHEAEDFIKNEQIDIAFEWQRGRMDFPLKNIIKKYNKKIPIILCLNWDGELPGDIHDLGYIDSLNIPIKNEDLFKIVEKFLDDRQKKILRVSKKLAFEKNKTKA